MQKGVLYRALSIVILTIVSVLYLVPSVVSPVPEWWPSLIAEDSPGIGFAWRNSFALERGIGEGD